MTEWVRDDTRPSGWRWTGDDPQPEPEPAPGNPRMRFTTPPPPLLFGIDVSGYQPAIDLARAAREGVTFVIAKVSQGAGYRSPAWPGQRDRARAAGLLLAGYHYITGDPAAAQAANCRAALGADTGMPLALDWENNGGTWANFTAVLAAFRAAGLNVRLAYAPRWYWQQQGSPDMRTASLPLWSSRYVTGAGTPAQLYPQVTPDQWAGYGGAPVALVQFTDNAQVAGTQVDASAFRGTRDQLVALLTAPAPQGVDPVLQSHDIPPGQGMWQTICPVGRASAYYRTGWLSASVTGPSAGSAQVWFQNDAGGIFDTRWAINFADGHSTRPIAQLPDGCTQVRVAYDFPDGGVICLEMG